MNKEILTEKLSKVSDFLTIEQLIESRESRNWKMFDKLSEIEKLIYRLEEIEIYMYSNNIDFTSI